MNGAAQRDPDGAALGVRVGDFRRAIPARHVTQVIRAAATRWTRVPYAPSPLLGIANLRGTMLPVISLARLLGMQPAPPSPAARVVMIECGARFGLLVDEVHALARTAGDTLLDLDALLGAAFAAAPMRHAAQTAGASSGGPAAAVRDGGSQLTTVLGVMVAGQEYGWPLDLVREVITIPPAIAVPGTDPAMRGVIKWRGSVLPAVSLRVLLGQAAHRAPEAESAIVVRLWGAPVALVVDRMTGIHRFSPNSIQKMPELLLRGGGEARITAIARLPDGRLVSLLAPDHLFDDATTRRLQALAARDAPMQAAPAPSHETAAPAEFVVFALSGELYGLPIGAVTEVVRRPGQLTRLPHAPDFVAGVMNLRGRVVPVIEQYLRFAGPAPPAQGRGRVLIVEMGPVMAGFAVDAVSEIRSVDAADIQALPPMAADGAGVFQRAVQDRAGRNILLIEPAALLHGAERDLLAAFAAASARVDAA